MQQQQCSSMSHDDSSLNVNEVLARLRAELRDVANSSCLVVIRNDSSATLALHRADVSSSTSWIAVNPPSPIESSSFISIDFIASS